MTSSRSYAWVGRMLRLQPARFPLGHSIRSAIAVGLPVIIAAATGRILDGMWVALATLLIAAGEREGSHWLNVRILLIATPIAATGYFLGYLQAWPLWSIIPLMVVLGWIAGAIAGYGVAFSIAGMQFLLVAAIAQGVSGYSTWWQPVVWYLVGAAFYLVMMLVEFAVDRRRPERLVLDDVIDALDTRRCTPRRCRRREDRCRTRARCDSPHEVAGSAGDRTDRGAAQDALGNLQ